MRKKIPVTRELLIAFPDQIADAKRIAEVIKEMKEDEFIVGFQHIQKHEPAPFANEPGETVWVDRQIFYVRSYRDETDDEYLARKKEEERIKTEQLEREKIQYLNLKAKFEL